MPNPDKDKLISAVYSATMSPDNYNETIEDFDELIYVPQDGDSGSHAAGGPEAIQAADRNIQPKLDPAIDIHIQRAHDIQLRVGQQKLQKQKILMLLDAAPNPAYLIDQNKKLIAMNNHAKNNLKNTCQNWEKCLCCTKLNECFINREVLKRIFKFISNSGEQKLLIVPGYENNENNTNNCAVVKKLENYSGDALEHNGDQAEVLYFISIVDLGFDRSTTELFRNTYDLTPAEVDIAIQLANGKQLAEIATARGSTIKTIRTQFKSIKKKTGSRDIPAVVRLLCGFSAGILISSQLTQTDMSIIHLPSKLKTFDQIVLRDGRKMTYLEQGNPTGAPVMMFHNMPYGVELPQKAIEAAVRMNLRIITPYRPGFGNSDPVLNPSNDKLLDEVAADMCELMDRLSIAKANIVGQVIGANYAMRFARLFPNRVSHLFAISRVPIWRNEWLAKMPKRQRLVMHIAKYLPQLLPLIIQSTVMFIDKGHVEKLVYTLVKDCTADRQALKRYPEIVKLIAIGVEEGMKQGAKAFCHDCFLTLVDFSEEARALNHSFHILHGDMDEIIDISLSKTFAELVPGTELEIVKGAGHLLFYSHWDRVLKAIKNKQTK